MLGRQHFAATAFSRLLCAAVGKRRKWMLTVFGYYVNDPERFGIVEFGESSGSFPWRENPRSQSRLRDPRACISTTNAVVQMAEGGKMALGPRRAGDPATLNRMYLKGGLDLRLWAAALPGWTPARWTALWLPGGIFCAWWKPGHPDLCARGSYARKQLDPQKDKADGKRPALR